MSAPPPAGILGILALAASAAHQAPPSFPMATEIVKVTLTARGAKGHLVSDLKKEDLAVFEDGRPQTVCLFAQASASDRAEALAVDLGLLVDTSGSMASELELTQQAAVRFLDTVPRARELLTIFFDDDIRVSRYDSEHQQGLFQRIQESRASGRTPLYDALAVYLARVHDAPGRKVALLLTDGEDSASALSRPELFGLVRSSSTTIYSIAFAGEYRAGSSRALSAISFLRQLGELTGGDVVLASGPEDLAPAYDRILDELGAQYVLGFVSDNPRRDGRYRKLKVQAKREELKLRYREGYVAPGER